MAVCVIAFTVTASVIDYRTQRIPNKLTLPMFAAGWVYQLALCPEGPWYGFKDGLSGFAIGFGMFFLLWILGSGGGGDAKMVGALAVWLGFHKTIFLIILSTLIVIVVTGGLLLYGMLTRGVYRTKRDFIPDPKASKKKKSSLELLEFNRGRKGMTYGLSVAIATILIVVSWSFVQAAAQRRIDREAEKAAAQASREADVQQDADAEKPKSVESKAKPATTETDKDVKDQDVKKSDEPAEKTKNTSATSEDKPAQKPE